MFDHDKVRFSSAQSLAEDILKLSHRRSEILLGYLGIDSLVEVNGTLPQDTRGSLEPHWDNLKVTKVFNGVASNTGGLNSRQLKELNSTLHFLLRLDWTSIHGLFTRPTVSTVGLVNYRGTNDESDFPFVSAAAFDTNKE